MQNQQHLRLTNSITIVPFSATSLLYGGKFWVKDFSLHMKDFHMSQVCPPPKKTIRMLTSEFIFCTAIKNLKYDL